MAPCSQATHQQLLTWYWAHIYNNYYSLLKAQEAQALARMRRCVSFCVKTDPLMQHLRLVVFCEVGKFQCFAEQAVKHSLTGTNVDA